jgi:hypothetical protein
MQWAWSAVLILLSAFIVKPEGQVTYFQASYQGSDVRLEWKVNQSAAQGDFYVYRRKSDEEEFTKLGDMENTGADSYTFIDQNLYKASESLQTAMTYKLVVHSQASNESYFASIQRNPTAVQRSWGSIKVMFR